MIQESQKWLRDFFSSHAELMAAGKAERVAVIRDIADRSREDAATRSYTEWLAQEIEPELPMETAVFRAYYLDGQTARQVSHTLSMDKRSVYRCINRGLEAMLPLVFGLDGLWNCTVKKGTRVPADKHETRWQGCIPPTGKSPSAGL